MDRQLVYNTIGLYVAVLGELREEGFTPDDFNFDELVDMVVEKEKEEKKRNK